MACVLLGVGDYGAVSKPGESLKTMALGSCVAVVLMDPVTHCVGMDHVALPDSAAHADRAKQKPGHFADTGIPALLEAMYQAGVPRQQRHGIIVKLIGGANVMDPCNTFNIGKRNVLAIKKVLWQFGMGAVAEDVGGQISRTVTVDVDEGRVLISSPGLENWVI